MKAWVCFPCRIRVQRFLRLENKVLLIDGAVSLRVDGAKKDQFETKVAFTASTPSTLDRRHDRIA